MVLRKKFFTVRLMRYWNKSPTAAANAPSLKAFKGRMERALSSLV